MRFTLVLFLGVCAAALAIEPVNIYVSPAGNDSAAGTEIDSPLKTIARAAEMARGIKDKPVTVMLRESRYEIAEPLKFALADSRTKDCPLIFRPYKDEEVLISGGRPITGWKKQDNNVWTTQVDDVKSGKWYFTQLFVNGQRGTRARTPNEGFYRVAGFPDGGPEAPYNKPCQRFEYKQGDINPNWTNLSDAKVIVYHFWTDSHMPIESVDAGKRMVTFKHKSGKKFTDAHSSEGARYIVENVFEAIDSPGEWYLNRQTGVLTYKAIEGEDLNKLEVMAPVSGGLMIFDGNAGERKFVENIRFENIEFAYTDFVLPIGDSNDGQASCTVPAAIKIKGCKNLTFEHCTIRDIGTYAFDLQEGCKNISLKSNKITGLGGGGIRVNGGNAGSHPLLRTGNNLIEDNVIGPFGLIYRSAVGVLLMQTFGNTVSHNEIHHGWYTGVSVGWEWGYQRSISRDNIIEYNHIHHIGQGLLSDMGAIYTLGVSPGTVIRNNLIHDVDSHNYGGWGIYNDEGSSHILVENNIVFNTKYAGYMIHYSREITVRNNIYAFGTHEQLYRGRVEPHKSCFFENNIVYFKEGTLLVSNWKDEPYETYYSPVNGKLTEKSTFEMDWNVYYNPAVSADKMEFNGATFAQWQKRGKDRHSVVADPLFVDADKRDFRLKEDSPALKLGFVQIDMSTVGPRKTNMEK